MSEFVAAVVAAVERVLAGSDAVSVLVAAVVGTADVSVTALQVLPLLVGFGCWPAAFQHSLHRQYGFPPDLECKHGVVTFFSTCFAQDNSSIWP